MPASLSLRYGLSQRPKPRLKWWAGMCWRGLICLVFFWSWQALHCSAPLWRKFLNSVLEILKTDVCNRVAGGAPHGWRTSYVLVLLLLGIALMGSFIGWEGWCKYPAMPLRIWRDRNFSLVCHPTPPFPVTVANACLKINVVVLLGFMPFTTSAFLLSLYMQNVLRYSALTVAIHILPQAIGGILVNIVVALVLHRVNNKLPTGIGALAYLGSTHLLTTMKEGSSYWAFIFPSLVLSVIGADLQFNVANVSLSCHEAVPRDWPK